MLVLPFLTNCVDSNCKVAECEGDAREVTGGKIRSERVREAITGVFLTQQEKRTT